MKRSRIVALVVALLLVVAACGSSDADDTTTTTAAETGGGAEETTTTTTKAPDTGGGDTEAVEVRWFIGLGAGGQPEQRDAQIAVVDAFNASQDEIILVPEIVDNDVAYDALATQIASGNGPDIIGPVGRDGSNSFAGLYLDIEPLIESTGVPVDMWSGVAVDGQREGDGTLVGLPFASFPSAIYYNRDMFDAAGLPYPPQEYAGQGSSATYGAGTEWEGPWDFDKVAEIGKILSVDANGVYGDEAAYDRTQAVEFGFVWQWTDAMYQQGSFWGGGYARTENNTGEIPQQWQDEWQWYQDAVWVDGFAPSQEQVDALGNAFQSGNVAMGATHLWYTCCIADAANDLPGDFWDYAIMPANPNTGQTTANLHADTFRILKDTNVPDEAFAAMYHLVTEAALPLLTAYGAAPAEEAKTEAFIANLDTAYPQGVNWQTILDGANYSETPSHETSLPGWEEYKEAMGTLRSALLTDPDLDLAAAIADLEDQLTGIYQANS